MKFYVKLIMFFVYLVCYCKSDIPTHCLQHQVVGKWNFEATVMKKYNLDSIYDLKCGIRDHTKDASIVQANINKNLFVEKFTVELNSDNTAKYDSVSEKGLKGTWTMVYDEGFEILIGERSKPNFKNYFVFLKYSQNDHSTKAQSKWVSHCYQSMIGWYHIGDKDWGCFRGHKDLINFSAVTNGEASDKQIVLQNSIVPAFIEENEVREDFKNFLGSSRFLQNEWKISNKIKAHSNNKLLSEIRLTLESTNHNEVVERINSMNLSWKAAEYEQFKGYSIGEINNFLNNKRNDGRFNFNLTKSQRYQNSRYEGGKTESLDYTSILGSPKSQGNCGSCYAVSTISMLEARFNHKYKDTIQKYHKQQISFSEHQVLRCSYYNQGCNGGYSHLVSKFYKEYEMLPSVCFDLQNKKCHQECKGEHANLNKLKFKVKDYYYVGGYFGAANEDNLLEELKLNGPFVISIAPDYGFTSYSSGIYDSNTQNWKTMNVNKPEWQKVDHSVLLVGYGVQNGIEYWKILNSWGRDWGESGYMRIVKGKNLLNIESLGEAATVELIEN